MHSESLAHQWMTLYPKNVTCVVDACSARWEAQSAETAYHEGDDADDDDPEGVVEVVGDTGEGLPAYDAVEDQEAPHGEYREGAGDDRAVVSECWWLTVCRPATHASQRGGRSDVPPGVSC